MAAYTSVPTSVEMAEAGEASIPVKAPMAKSRRGVLTFLLVVLGILTITALNVEIVQTPTSKAPEVECVVLHDSHLEMEFVKKDACWSRTQVQEILHGLTVSFIEILEKHDIDYWLDSGTLLGAVRNQGVIPHDCDADFGLTKESMDKLRNTTIELPEDYVLWVLYSPIHPWSHRDEALPGRWVHTKSGLYIDLFEFHLHQNVRREYTETMAIDDNTDFVGNASIIDQIAGGMNREKAESIKVSGEVKVTYTIVEDMIAPPESVCWSGCAECPKPSFFQIPRSWVFPLQKCSFEGRMAFCPAKPHYYLKTLYGPNYMTPQ